MRLLAVSLATALLAASCGGAATSSSPTPSTAAATPSPAASPTIVAKVATDAKLGKILVATNGMTLYVWAKDTDQNSQCSDQCAQFWPPLTATTAKVAGDGVTGAFATSARKDGALQVTFNSHPLYFYSRDTAAGQTTGHGSTGFGAVWTVVQVP